MLAAALHILRHRLKSKDQGGRWRKYMKKTVSALVAAALLSLGVAYADEVKKTAAVKPADKPVAEAPMTTEGAAAHTHKAKAHHKRTHADTAKPGDGSVAPAGAAASQPAAAKAPETPRK
jgi:hypothetical protein